MSQNWSAYGSVSRAHAERSSGAAKASMAQENSIDDSIKVKNFDDFFEDDSSDEEYDLIICENKLHVNRAESAVDPSSFHPKTVGTKRLNLFVKQEESDDGTADVGNGAAGECVQPAATLEPPRKQIKFSDQQAKTIKEEEKDDAEMTGTRIEPIPAAPPAQNKPKWTDQEDDLLRKAYDEIDDSDYTKDEFWEVVAQREPGRTAEMCKRRFSVVGFAWKLEILENRIRKRKSDEV